MPSAHDSFMEVVCFKWLFFLEGTTDQIFKLLGTFNLLLISTYFGFT